MQAGCSGWRRVSGVIYSPRVLARVQTFDRYKMVVRHGMLFGHDAIDSLQRFFIQYEDAQMNVSRCL